jgi:transposase
VSTRGSENYQSDEAKENASLRKELRDTQNALEILNRFKILDFRL